MFLDLFIFFLYSDCVFSLKYVKKPGFTLVELIMVILIIGVIAAVAIPRFQSNIYTKAKANAQLATAGAVKAGIAAYRAQQIVNKATPLWPTVLDSVPAGYDASRTRPFFVNVLEPGFYVTSGWRKISTNPIRYRGPTGTLPYYRYDPKTGSFEAW